MKKYPRCLAGAPYLLVTFLTFLLPQRALTQGFYADIKTGYQFRMASQSNFSLFNYSSKNAKATYEAVYSSFGQGIETGISGGYMFSRHIGAELSFSYLQGHIQETEQVSGNNYSTSYLFSSRLFRATPSLVLSCGYEKFNPYARFGLIINTGTVWMEVRERISGDSWTTTFIFNNGLSLGINSAIGMEYKFRNNISFLTEINSVNLSYAPGYMKVTQFEKNGDDLLSTLTTRQKEKNW